MAGICEGARAAQKPARGCAPGRWWQRGAVTTPGRPGQGEERPQTPWKGWAEQEPAGPGALGCERPSLSLFELLPRARGEGEVRG